MKNSSPDDSARSLFESHERDFAANRYVYPVLSRRSGGISIGVNLNRDKACNFNCVYCQVNRNEPGTKEPIDLIRLANELSAMVELVLSGRIYEDTRFRHTPDNLRRLNDIAISGDGEPTAHAAFAEVMSLCAEVCRAPAMKDVTLVLITNASLLHQDHVRRALETLDAVDGEIWAKLDAGTEAYYRQVARSRVPWQQVLSNLTEAAKTRPIVIQSLLMRMMDQPPPTEEQQAYCDRLSEIVDAGGRIKLVQIHTVARAPAESWVTPLGNEELDAIADLVRHRTGLPVATYHASPVA